MRILLLGNRGQLGWELARTLVPLGEVLGLDFPIIDMASPGCIAQIVQNSKPDLIVNATAYTDVDRAESEPDNAFAINAIGPGILAEQAQKNNAAVLHYSTDYVFDGQKSEPYNETDSTNPINIYGKSKLSGEQNIRQSGCAWMIFRTSWVYSLRSENFVTKVLRWSRQQENLRIVSDQISKPTWARMLAEISAQLLAIGKNSISSWFEEHKGIYHLASEEVASRFDWAQAILELDPHKEEQVTREVIPALTADFLTPARRPLYTALSCKHFTTTFDLTIPNWRSSLLLAMEM